jgi:ankyrin repeat protein
MHAVWSHDLATVEAVLAAKPDINATNDKGETALSIAQGLNEANIAQALLNKKTDSTTDRKRNAEALGRRTSE